MLNAKDTVSDQRIEEIKKMIWEIFDTYKDGSSIARQYQLFQDMKDLNIEILASNNQFRMENKQLKQQLHDIKDFLASDIEDNYMPNRMMSNWAAYNIIHTAFIFRKYVCGNVGERTSSHFFQFWLTMLSSDLLHW